MSKQPKAQRLSATAHAPRERVRVVFVSAAVSAVKRTPIRPATNANGVLLRRRAAAAAAAGGRERSCPPGIGHARCHVSGGGPRRALRGGCGGGRGDDCGGAGARCGLGVLGICALLLVARAVAQLAPEALDLLLLLPEDNLV